MIHEGGDGVGDAESMIHEGGDGVEDDGSIMDVRGEEGS